ncbi:citrate (pro-3S)-lyase subunit beta [Cellulosilyticum sp. I15G10I2]|uniref:citrate (pro-3S)-lyase subunit beta n=1 Tax=Cellulosilyticum sp. I15G10I2 TaxID=1892843 RepID=UPI000A802C1E|nr:citrate (pro-3S)-lyase subunit beta [Cellulosilyticum sp. I15G10I2]
MIGKLRRTMLYVPGNNAAMIRDAHIYGSDSVMFDLEDSISIKEKDSARFLVFQALKTVDYGDKEIVIRVNGLDTPFGREDFKAMVNARPDIIRLPKTEKPEDVIEADLLITELEKEAGIEVGTIKMFAAIESALGILNAYPIASASKRLVGIAIGAEDFVTDLKTTRSKEGIELLAARSQIVFAARAAKISAIDTVFSDVEDEAGLIQETKLIKQLGFDGKSVINPRQIETVHNIFTPSQPEIKHARRVIEAIKQAEANGLGVIALDGKMIDKPIVERAIRVLDLANATRTYNEESGEFHD